MNLFALAGAAAVALGASAVATAAEPAATPAPSAAGVVDGGEYSVAAEASVDASGSGVLRVTVAAHDGFKVNALYPTRLVLQPRAGIALGGAPPGEVAPSVVSLGRNDAVVAEDRKSQRFELALHAAAPDRAFVEGTLRLSVCSESTCVIDTRKLRIPVRAKR